VCRGRPLTEFDPEPRDPASPPVLL
jgi:hypothetical protein